MENQNGSKREADEIQRDGEPASKKSKLSSNKPESTTSSLGRPIAEPSIFCYTEIIEAVEELLKQMREKPHLFDPNITVRMQSLDYGIEEQLTRLYLEWASDMLAEARLADSEKAEQFYGELLNNLFQDYTEDRREKPDYDLYGYLQFHYDCIRGTWHDNEATAAACHCTSRRNSDISMVSNGSERSDGSDGYVTAEAESDDGEVVE